MSDVVNPWKAGRAGQCNAVSKGTRCEREALHLGPHVGGQGLSRVAWDEPAPNYYVATAQIVATPKGCTAKEWSDAAIDKIRQEYGPGAATFVKESQRPVDVYEINASPGQALTLTGESRALVLGQRLAEAVAMPAAIEDARWRWRLRTGGAVSVDMNQRCVVALHFAADGFSNVQTMSVTYPELVACSLRNMTDAWLMMREGERVKR